jgi:hypothetical protein
MLLHRRGSKVVVVTYGARRGTPYAFGVSAARRMIRIQFGILHAFDSIRARHMLSDSKLL